MNVVVSLWVSKMYSGVASSCEMFDWLNVFHSAFTEERVNLLNQTFIVSIFST